jgi:hypothetical protein
MSLVGPGEHDKSVPAALSKKGRNCGNSEYIDTIIIGFLSASASGARFGRIRAKRRVWFF